MPLATAITSESTSILDTSKRGYASAQKLQIHSVSAVEFATTSPDALTDTYFAFLGADCGQGRASLSLRTSAYRESHKDRVHAYLKALSTGAGTHIDTSGESPFGQDSSRTKKPLHSTP